MGIYRKEVKLKKREFYIQHLSILNCFLPVKLTPKEIELLAAFMELELTKSLKYDRFGVVARNIVRANLDISSAGLSNYLKSLKDKGFLKEIEGVLTILPVLFPKESVQHYAFKIVKDETN